MHNIALQTEMRGSASMTQLMDSQEAIIRAGALGILITYPAETAFEHVCVSLAVPGARSHYNVLAVFSSFLRLKEWNHSSLKWFQNNWDCGFIYLNLTFFFLSFAPKGVGWHMWISTPPSPKSWRNIQMHQQLSLFCIFIWTCICISFLYYVS